LSVLWIGASDTVSEDTWVWESTGKNLSPGYMGWVPGFPTSTCSNNTSDCVGYYIGSTLPAWIDFSCTYSYGGICELQPENLFRSTHQSGDKFVSDDAASEFFHLL